MTTLIPSQPSYAHGPPPEPHCAAIEIVGATYYTGLKAPSQFLSLLTYTPRPKPHELWEVYLDARDSTHIHLNYHIVENAPPSSIPFAFSTALTSSQFSKILIMRNVLDRDSFRRFIWDQVVDPRAEWNFSYLLPHITLLQIVTDLPHLGSAPALRIVGDETLCQLMEDSL